MDLGKITRNLVPKDPDPQVSMTLKSVSSNSESWKKLDSRSKEFEKIKEINNEDLKSSSSAETIAIRDKIVLPDGNKFKEFVDNKYQHIGKSSKKVR